MHLPFGSLLVAVTLSLVLPAQKPTQKNGRQPADPLDGPPFVNAVSWAIVDGKSGAFLWGKNEDKVLPMASTTKMMTALVILRLAVEHEHVLAERVQISRFAASTGGSSARVRAGDKVVVSDLLYGLLLPSGNDAANALAEHFGPRFAAPARRGSVPWTPRSAGASKGWINFVAEMNRHAVALKMKRTRYVNPHGLDAKGHFSTAREILLLARAAMALPEFRRRVGTTEYRATIITGAGTRRIAQWKSTNRLLAIAGYNGVKTGTTTKAGACLVSSATRGDEQLLVVVLNSNNRLGRYVDTRNLFRWAFHQRLAGGK